MSTHQDLQGAQPVEEPEQVEDNSDQYTWYNETRQNMPVSLSYDIDEGCGYDVAEHALKSTVFSALGAVLFLEAPMIIWIDFDHRKMEDIAMITSQKTPRIYYSGIMKNREYYFKECGTHRFGLNDAMQQFKIKSDIDLQAFGLELHLSCFPFIENGEREVRYLILHPEKVKQGPYRCNLIRWLGMKPKDLSQKQRDKLDKIMKRPFPLAYMNQ